MADSQGEAAAGPESDVAADPSAPTSGAGWSGSSGWPGSPGWLRVLLVAGAAVSLLLLGAAVGLLIGLPGSPGAAAPAADSVDVGFCQDMSVHHRQAATMAALAREHSTDQRIRGLAFDIETSQLGQVGRMQGWLTLWGRDPLPAGSHMGWMRDTGMAGHGEAATGGLAQMPGMATQEELDRLGRARGAEFDVLFLQLMVRHHQGGASMMSYAAEHAEVGVVRTLAGQMLGSQRKEIGYMTELLTERGAQPLPAPN